MSAPWDRLDVSEISLIAGVAMTTSTAMDEFIRRQVEGARASDDPTALVARSRRAIFICRVGFTSTLRKAFQTIAISIECLHQKGGLPVESEIEANLRRSYQRAKVFHPFPRNIEVPSSKFPSTQIGP